MHFRTVSTPQLAGKIQKVQEIRYTKLVARVLPGVVYVANLVTWCTAPGWAGDNGQSCWSSKCNLLTVARSELTKAGTLSCARHPGTRGHTTAAVRVLRFLYRCILIYSQYSEVTIFSLVKASLVHKLHSIFCMFPVVRVRWVTSWCMGGMLGV